MIFINKNDMPYFMLVEISSHYKMLDLRLAREDIKIPPVYWIC